MAWLGWGSSGGNLRFRGPESPHACEGPGDDERETFKVGSRTDAATRILGGAILGLSALAVGIVGTLAAIAVLIGMATSALSIGQRVAQVIAAVLFAVPAGTATRKARALRGLTGEQRSTSVGDLIVSVIIFGGPAVVAGVIVLAITGPTI